MFTLIRTWAAKKGCKVLKMFVYDMCYNNRMAMVHIRGADMKRWDGLEKLHRVLFSLSGSAGRDIRLKGY